jgi:hypothetical protein
VSQRANHLTDAQIEAFAAQAAEQRFETESHTVTGHISECGECLSRFLQTYQSQLRFPTLATPASSQCLVDDDLRQMAAGIAGPKMAADALKHVPLCGHCGPLLRQYLEDFGDDLPEDGRQMVNLSKSAAAEWQREMVKQIVRKSFLGRALDGLRGLWHSLTGTVVMRLSTSAAALAVLLGGGVLLQPRYLLYSANSASLTAASDGGQRTIAMRLPGAGYAPYEPLPTVMGGDTGQESSKKGPALLEAEAAVARARQAGKIDSRWRWIDGRTALLEGTASGATRAADTLEKVRTEGQLSARLQIELAAACFERDNRADRPNLAKTIDLLEGVLAMPEISREDRSVALFNVAIAYEKINAWQLVSDRLVEYLKLDPSGPWSNEARTRLDAAHAKLPPPRQQGYRTPSFFFFIGLIPASSNR